MGWDGDESTAGYCQGGRPDLVRSDELSFDSGGWQKGVKVKHWKTESRRTFKHVLVAVVKSGRNKTLPDTECKTTSGIKHQPVDLGVGKGWKSHHNPDEVEKEPELQATTSMCPYAIKKWTNSTKEVQTLVLAARKRATNCDRTWHQCHVSSSCTWSVNHVFLID